MEKYGRESHETSGLGTACVGVSSSALDLRGTSIHSGTLSCAGTQRNKTMKKLMIAASAALLATVGFSIESSNVVGYQNKDVRRGLSQQACTFDQIGVEGGALDIQRLIPVDENGDYIGDGDINIQFITYVGRFEKSYAYYGADELNDGLPAGWYDEDTEELADYTFASGEAFQVSGGSVAKFVYSGEVNMAETDIPFRRGLSFQANVRPSNTDIQSIIPVDANGDYIGDGDINIQFYTYVGRFDKSYAYYGDDELNDGLVAGWYDEDNEELADYTFAAGEGFKLSAGSAGYLRFPEL